MVLVVASSRPWHLGMGEKLVKLTGLAWHQIGSIDELNAEFLSDIGATQIFFPHWSHIIPAAVFENFECVIFHMTDLPYGRGGSPLQNLIVRGHSNTVISALRCERGIDTGPVFLKRPLSLAGPAHEIFDRATAVIETMIVDIVREGIKPKIQEGLPTHFKRRKPADSDMRDVKSAREIYDHIRMVDADGYPKAYVEVGNLRIEFEDAQLEENLVTARVSITIRSESS